MYVATLEPSNVMDATIGGPVPTAGKEKSKHVEGATKRVCQFKWTSWMDGHRLLAEVCTTLKDVPCAVGLDAIAAFNIRESKNYIGSYHLFLFFCGIIRLQTTVCY